MNSTFSQNRSDAIQAMLVEQVTTDDQRAVRLRPHRWLVTSALVIAGALAGSGVSAAAFAITTASSDSEWEITAPPGVIPGEPIISLLGHALSQRVVGDADLALADLPPAATHVRVTVVCLTTGTVSWGFDPSGNNPSSSCSTTDVDSPSGGAYFDFELTPEATTLFVRAAAEVSAVVSYQYLNYVPTALGVNDRGETFGGLSGDRRPDLVAVIGTTSDGSPIDGYARATDLDAFGPDWPRQPSNPDEALEWQTKRDAAYPTGWDIPVYASDGVTVIGSFHVG